MGEWLLIALGGILVNVIRLIVNSVERIYRDQIDNLVKATPSFFQQAGNKVSRTAINFFVAVAVELYHAILIVCFLPTLIVFKLFPQLYKLPPFRNLERLNSLLLSRNFRFVFLSAVKLVGFFPFVFWVAGIIRLKKLERLSEPNESPPANVANGMKP